MNSKNIISLAGTAIIGLVFLAVLTLPSCSPVKEDSSPNKSEAVYDSTLAAKYGADNYGMKRYVMAFLKRGPNRPTDSLKAAELQKAHLKNINRLAEEGKLVLAGPFIDNGDVRGIYIFDVPTIEEARNLTATDPAIQAGSLEMELRPWYGSAAVMAINDIHNKLIKKSIVE